jgi:predicted transcriptional regulator
MDPDDFFGEENMSFEDFLAKLYNLKDFDKEVHRVILKSKKPQRCEMVKKKLDRDTVAVYRSLQKLVRAGLCQKDRKPLKAGGHYMEYSGISYDDARDPLLEKMDQWYKECKTIIENR